MSSNIPTVRKVADNATVLNNLGLLAELAGRWHGTGFNLVARPDFEDQTNLFLELNLTSETTEFTPISSSIPNRGFCPTRYLTFWLDVSCAHQRRDHRRSTAHRARDLGHAAGDLGAVTVAASRRATGHPHGQYTPREFVSRPRHCHAF